MPDFTPEKFLLFLAFVAPGFFAMQVYSLWYPSQKKEWGTSLVETVCYSLLIYTLWSRWLIRHAREGGIVNDHGQLHAGALFQQPDLLFEAMLWIGLATPVVLASVLYLLRCHVLPKLVRMDHPTRTAWDYAFSKNRCAFVVCTLKDGQQIGGLYGGRSYATSFPVDQELFIERVCLIKDGKPVEWVPGSRGMVIKTAECRTVEFLELPMTAGGGNGTGMTPWARLAAWLRFTFAGHTDGKP